MARTSDVASFVKAIDERRIPDYAGYINRKAMSPTLHNWSVRSAANKAGMWAIVDMTWTKKLADWIDGRKVLEVMAGAGWLARALYEHGVDITATDDFSWYETTHRNIRPLYPIKQMDAVRAVRAIPADVLVISWPPYKNETVIDVCRAWGGDKPIVYIGEWVGCCATEEFFERLYVDHDDDPQITIPSWPYIHDCLSVCRWNE